MKGICWNCSTITENCESTLCRGCDRNTMAPYNYKEDKNYFIILYNNEFFKAQSDLPIKIKKVDYIKINKHLFKSLNIRGFWGPWNKINKEYPDIFEIKNDKIFELFP